MGYTIAGVMSFLLLKLQYPNFSWLDCISVMLIVAIPLLIADAIEDA